MPAARPWGVRVPTDLSRYADWTTWLAEQGATDPDVRVVWVGGSAATGGYDAWSDLDVDLRYLHEDLPPDVAARVTALLPGAADPAEASAACFAWTDELLARRGRP
jgi:hypothetical protein